MEIIIESMKLSAVDTGGDVYIYIDRWPHPQGEGIAPIEVLPRVKASELKAAIEALEKTCHRI